MTTVKTNQPGGHCWYVIIRIIKQAHSCCEDRNTLKCRTPVSLSLSFRFDLWVCFSFLVWLYDDSVKDVEELPAWMRRMEMKEKELQTTCTHSSSLCSISPASLLNGRLQTGGEEIKGWEPRRGDCVKAVLPFYARTPTDSWSGSRIRVGPNVGLYRAVSSSPPPLLFIWAQGWCKDGPMTVAITQSIDKHRT